MTAEALPNLTSDPDTVRHAPRLHVRLLGEFQVTVDGQPVLEATWRQRRAASIVKLLALEPTHRLHREQLIDLLWPDLDYSAQLNNLRQALHHARHGLEAVGMPAGLALRRDGDIVVLAPTDQVWVDVHAFERAVANAWQVLAPDAARAALALYRGDLLPDDRYDEWAEQRRTTLRASYLALLARLATLHDERGEATDAIGAWQRLAAVDPTNEAAHVALMRHYADAGQRQHALAQFDQLVTVLERELDTSPEPATWELAESIREGRFPKTAARGMPPTPVSSINLPVPISQLVGREQELAELRQLLATERLVTLTGPGGIGKTRLAIELAQCVGGTFPDGVAFVDLASVRDPERVIAVIAEVLGLRETGDQPLTTSLTAALREKRQLLVLDNFEQVVAAGREIALLLERSPTLKAIVTSRDRLRLRGEREYAVPPLAVADDDSPAVALFVSRAPNVADSAQNRATIAAICRRLDGLPLAIELAAARSQVLSPQAILDRLRQPLTLLVAGASDLPERQQTIKATIQWSYDLLDPNEQALFTHLSVFVGGWTLDAAEAVVADLNDGMDVLGGLESLAGKSLITRQAQPGGEIRFGMLVTIREFGLERLAASNADDRLRDRHAAWVVRLVERAEPHLESAEQAEWLAHLASEYGNVHAALAWLRERGSAEQALRLVRALRLYWFTHGRIRDGLEQMDAVIAMPECAASPMLLADVQTAIGFLARESGDYTRAYTASRAALAISHQINDRKRAADGLVTLGYIKLQQGRADDARSLLQRSLTTNRELDNQQGIADTLGFLALTDLQLGDPDAAEQRLEACLRIWGTLDDHQGVNWSRIQLGIVRLEQRDYSGACHDLLAGLDGARALDFRSGIVNALDGLARLAAIHGQPLLAVRLAASAASIREDAGIRLSPVEETGVERLLSTLRDQLGGQTIDAIRRQDAGWTMDEIRQEIVDILSAEVTMQTTVDDDVSTFGRHGKCSTNVASR